MGCPEPWRHHPEVDTVGARRGHEFTGQIPPPMGNLGGPPRVLPSERQCTEENICTQILISKKATVFQP